MPHLTNLERTPQSAWAALKEGNRRFQTFNEERPNTDFTRRMELTNGQNPIAVVLSCSDSRVPVELIFDQGLGDVFVIRTAGEIIDLSVLASLEYAVEDLHVKVIVVLGHESCGAVAATKAAMEGAGIPDGFRRVLVEKISPSIMNARDAGKSTAEEFESHHVAETVDQIISRSPEVKSKLQIGEVGIVGVRYRLSDGYAEPVVEIGVD
ncbi:carbonic anhydrase [Corynebacterium epidermidicanis]|uniref:Carbonic anhydrase n=1 Tax=Corynebacterium epidermidicanis TaxID=1050174 RepID=A0A0G3GS60_9CORY|nr:carbonic anhydrase [Corynebacterium epidermidicanis]AKK03969.1 carbonic anhydrase [Corynebacterium epidermidicanis]